MRKIPILRRLTAPLGLNRFQPQPILRRFATRCHCVNDLQAQPVIKLQKKALIVGIQYAGTPGKLTNTHRDARLWRDLLIRKYGFDAKNIVMMLDDGKDPWFSPTKNNILREIANFVEGVNAGDELVFYYSGHTGQLETEDPNEEDGLNEVLVPVDHVGYVELENAARLIVDNDLRERLVDRLPIGSKLTAVFDSCHSGTLLDLDHYLCNEVYHPFLCRAPSKQKSKWIGIERKNAHGPNVPASEWTVEGHGSPRPAVNPVRAASTEGARIHQRLRESSEKVSCIDTALTQLHDNADKQRRFQVETREHMSTHSPSRANSASSPLPERRADSESESASLDATRDKPARTDSTQDTEPARRTSVAVQTRRTSVQLRQTSTQSERARTKRAATRQNSLASVIGSLNLCRTTSPEQMQMGALTACAGSCIQSDAPKPDVTSLAATHDRQEAYEGGPDGYSMTKVLVEILDNDPHPTYHELAYRLGKICCAKVKDIEKRNAQRKEENKKRKKKKRVLDRINWTVPQIGSMMPEVLNSRFMKKDTPKQ